jgi:hypothetical protein
MVEVRNPGSPIVEAGQHDTVDDDTARPSAPSSPPEVTERLSQSGECDRGGEDEQAASSHLLRIKAHG